MLVDHRYTTSCIKLISVVVRKLIPVKISFTGDCDRGQPWRPVSILRMKGKVWITWRISAGTMAGAVAPVVRTTVAQTANITTVVAPASRILCPHCHTYLPMGRSSKSIFSSQYLPLYICIVSWCKRTWRNLLHVHRLLRLDNLVRLLPDRVHLLWRWWRRNRFLYSA